MKNDLHIRTNFSGSSDKDLTWEKLLGICESLGLDRISITDFDTCIFYVLAQLMDTKRYFSGEILPGMECDVNEDGRTVELLAYNFDIMPIFAWTDRVYGTKAKRQQKIYDGLLNLVQKSGLKYDESAIFDSKNTFAHNFVYDSLAGFTENRAFLEQYDIATNADFYRLSTSKKDFPLYLNLSTLWPNIAEVADFIHSVGGVVVLANPMKHKAEIGVEKMLGLIERYNLDGVEVYHPHNTPAETQMLYDFAKSKNLLITGGSNYNGTDKYPRPGLAEITDDESAITLSRA